MLKLAGCICILLASAGMARSFIYGMRQELCQMEQLSELLMAMEGEVTYSRCPLPELLEQMAGHMQTPYREMLLACSRDMEANLEADIPALWQDVCREWKSQLVLSGEAYRILQRMGEAFSYHSLDASLQLLSSGKKRLETLLAESRAEFAEKRKLYSCLCYMTGLCSIILLW